MEALLVILAVLVGLGALFAGGGLLVALVLAVPQRPGIGPRPYWRRVIDRFNEL